jgi:ribosomal protein S27AE
MKKSRICPKCGNSNIVRIDGSVSAYGAGNNAMIGNTIFSAVPVARYICCDCGYSEEWIDEADLPKVRESRKAKRI